jgi:hypothetical protein
MTTTDVDFLADGLRALTREDAAIMVGLSARVRLVYYFGDRKDSLLMVKAELEAQLRREVRAVLAL